MENADGLHKFPVSGGTGMDTLHMDAQGDDREWKNGQEYLICTEELYLMYLDVLGYVTSQIFIHYNMEELQHNMEELQQLYS